MVEHFYSILLMANIVIMPAATEIMIATEQSQWRRRYHHYHRHQNALVWHLFHALMKKNLEYCRSTYDERMYGFQNNNSMNDSVNRNHHRYLQLSNF